MNLRAKFWWNPLSKRLKQNSVEVAVNTSFAVQYKVAQEIRAEDWEVEIEEWLEDARSARVVLLY